MVMIIMARNRKDGVTKASSGRIEEILAEPRLASLSAVSFPGMSA